jgi:hypothetical protein
MTGVASAAFAIAVAAPELRAYVAMVAAMGFVANVALVSSTT